MITENREFHYTCELTLHRSHVLDSDSQPKDDIVNWLLLKVGEKQFSFVYKINDPVKASYNIPFYAKLSFVMIEVVKNIIQLNHSYEVIRGHEVIGNVRIINILE